MMTLAQLERLALVVLILVFLLVGLITTGKLKAETYQIGSGGGGSLVIQYKQEHMPLSKEAQYVVMTVEEYNELVEKKCK